MSDPTPTPAPAREPLPAWAIVTMAIAGMVVALVVLLLVGGFCAWLYFLRPTPENAPAPLAGYTREVTEALADEGTGLGDEYLGGLFKATRSLLKADSFADRSEFHRYMTNLGEGWKYATALDLQPGDLFVAPYEWVEKSGPLTDDDKRRLLEATESVLRSLEAVD